MSTTAILNVRLIDPASETDAPGGVVFNTEGKIVDAGPHIKKPPLDVSEVIDGEGHVLAPGVIDLRVKTGEPGAEHKETLFTAAHAASAGGVTSFVVMPDTDPVIDTVALVSFIKAQADRKSSTQRRPVKANIYPAGGLTMGLEGNQMTEIGLMQEAGAKLFTNGEQAIPDAGVMARAMKYAAALDAVVMSRPDEHNLTKGAIMNACSYAGQLGLSGAPPLAELIALERDLALAEMTGVRLLVDQISTARSLEAVERARTRGVKAFCAVSACHIYFNDGDIGDYLTYCKVFPPFRSEDDRRALVDGLARGAIDAVVSAHDPQPPEDKRLPLAEAAYGAAGLETLVPAMLSLVHNEQISLLDAFAPLTNRPADLLGLPQGRLAKDAPADMILIDLNKPWNCKREDLRSRSQNSPFDGRLLQGQVLRTILGGKTVFNRKAEMAAINMV